MEEKLEDIVIKRVTPSFGTKEWFFEKLDNLEALDTFKDKQSVHLSKAFPDCMAVFDYRGLETAEESAILAGIIATGKEESLNWISWFISELNFGKSVSLDSESNCNINGTSYLVTDKESLWTVLQAL